MKTRYLPLTLDFLVMGIRFFYVLKVFGTFDEDAGGNWDWPPTATTTLTMTSWEMRVENQGSAIKNISCIGGRNFDDPMVIAVTLITDQESGRWAKIGTPANFFQRAQVRLIVRRYFE